MFCFECSITQESCLDFFSYDTSILGLYETMPIDNNFFLGGGVGEGVGGKILVL